MKHEKSIQQYLGLISEQKLALDALRPFDVLQLQNLKEWFVVQFTHQSNAIEGNTLSLTEVKLLIEEGITVGGKRMSELMETVNHAHITKQLRSLGESFALTQDAILDLHRVLMQGVLVDETVGVWREVDIRVSGSDDVFPEPGKLTTLMSQYVSDLQEGPTTLEQIARIHYDFVKIHPFADGNGRIARLLMNIGLISLQYFPIIIPVPVRSHYIDSLKGSDSFTEFYHFFLWQVYENHKDTLRFLRQ